MSVPHAPSRTRILSLAIRLISLVTSRFILQPRVAAGARGRLDRMSLRLAFLAALTALTVVPATASAATPPSGAFFVLTCRFSHSATDDPIVYPGQPDRSHDHVFVGNASTDASSTPASLAARHATTCSDTDDLSAYWAPMLYVAGKEVPPLEVTVYYRRLSAAPVQPFPAGLE